MSEFDLRIIATERRAMSVLCTVPIEDAQPIADAMLEVCSAIRGSRMTPTPTMSPIPSGSAIGLINFGREMADDEFGKAFEALRKALVARGFRVA